MNELPGPTTEMKTQLKGNLQLLHEAIIRLHTTSVPTSSCIETCLLSEYYLPKLNKTPTWLELKKSLENSFGKKQTLKKLKIQGGIYGITLVLRMFERLDLEGVGNSKGDCASWIDKLCKAIDAQACVDLKFLGTFY